MAQRLNDFIAPTTDAADSRAPQTLDPKPQTPSLRILFRQTPKLPLHPAQHFFLRAVFREAAHLAPIESHDVETRARISFP